MGGVWKKRLIDKLEKLDSTRESVEVTSQWCIFYRNEAQAIVETWGRDFEKASEDKKISLLYLANDILLNSVERNGCELFVNEFWRALPIYLVDIYQNGGQVIIEAVSKLVGIWEDRNVFKLGHHNLRTHFLGENPPSSSDEGFDPMRPRKRKLEVRFEGGGTAERILTAYQAAGEEHIEEDMILKTCESSMKRLKEIENDVHNTCLTGCLDITRSIQLSDELIQEETVLWECTKQLRSNESTTAAVISKLREAIQQEVIVTAHSDRNALEYKLETLRDQLKEATDSAESARRIRMRLKNITDGSHGTYTQTQIEPRYQPKAASNTVANTERNQIPAKGSFNDVYGPQNCGRGG